jgi:hypothetical protein
MAEAPKKVRAIREGKVLFISQDTANKPKYLHKYGIKIDDPDFVPRGSGRAIPPKVDRQQMSDELGESPTQAGEAAPPQAQTEFAAKPERNRPKPRPVKP